MVLHFQVVGAAGHGRVHSSQKVQSGLVPSCLSPRLNVLAVVDRSQVGRRRNVYVHNFETRLNYRPQLWQWQVQPDEVEGQRGPS